ncbi:winged helix-turn-helix transcriptional regulator [Amycolatopsis roodepoortensis]|uniref:winged helix-turn-helix transcriptional regulator n=1 Tax=Amycolatopsis roodepoortensis TaxID=700274 RepID=UPI00214B2197|nr:winged helix-turn-helix transcriptional regulator [Amycolatopsis roodepoortensis]UUV29054.1 winged helix-turn-helix transcriptional regulator [Amycolatopsis roodepoortensis]
MVITREYFDGCGTAHALDLVGSRWALLIVRELLLGPKRFTDLRAGLPGSSPTMLAQRLRELEQTGILRRRALPPPAASTVYELTEWGAELEPALLALGRWAARSPLMPERAPLSLDSLVLAMRTMFDPASAGDLEMAFQLRFGQFEVIARVGGGALEIGYGTLDRPDAVVTTSVEALREVIFEGRGLAQAIADGAVLVDGDLEAVTEFTGCFPLPEPAALPVNASRRP